MSNEESDLTRVVRERYGEWQTKQKERAEARERSRRAEEQRSLEIERERSRRPPVPPPPVTSLPTELGGLLDLPGGESFAKNPGEVARAQEQARAAREMARTHRDDPGVDTGG